MMEPTPRYADGPTTVRSVHIDAPADRVWDLVAAPALAEGTSTLEELVASEDGTSEGADR